MIYTKRIKYQLLIIINVLVDKYLNKKYYDYRRFLYYICGFKIYIIYFMLYKIYKSLIS